MRHPHHLARLPFRWLLSSGSLTSWLTRSRLLVGIALLLPILMALLTEPLDAQRKKKARTSDDPEDFRIVDCLLPGQIRQLGRRGNYVGPRRPLKTTALDCEIRGGEYVVFDRASYATATRVWLESAEGGDAKAQNYLGEIYERGLGAEAPDYSRAAFWFRRAAEQGHAQAQVNLGYLYEQGLGVERDTEEALRWYREAAGSDRTISIEPPETDTDPPPSDTPGGKTSGQAGSGPAPSEPDSLDTALAQQIERLRAEVEELRRQTRHHEDALEEVRRLRRDDAATQSDLEGAQLRLATARQAWEAAEKRQWGAEDLRHALGEAQTAVLATGVGAEARRDAEKHLARIEASCWELLGEGPSSGAVDAAVLAGSAPRIELVDPPLLGRALRPRILAPAELAQRHIVGRARGAVTLQVDGAEVPLSAEGWFRANVALAKPSRLVALEAFGADGSTSQRLELELVPTESASRAASDVASELGRSVALVIGNNDYRNLPDLRTAIHDAEKIAGILRRRYGFETELLLDATRYDLLSKLNALRTELDRADSLLIYYAGHGFLDAEIERGYWQPVDAERDNVANWVSNLTITDHLNALPARHVLVIADSCYSGALTRSSLARLEAGMGEAERIRWLRKMTETRSRTALTSGGLTPVLDGGGDGHSVFARALIDFLEANTEVLTGRQIHAAVEARLALNKVASDFGQVPEYSPIKYAGHEAGEFLIVPH